MEVLKSKRAPIDLELCISIASESAASEVADSFPPQQEERCDKTEYAEKVEAMLSTAIMQQEDIWNLLMLSVSEGLAYNPDTGGMSAVAKISPEYFFTMKGKLENSINWCSLAQSRLKSIIPPDRKQLTPSMQRYRPRLVDESEIEMSC